MIVILEYLTKQIDKLYDYMGHYLLHILFIFNITYFSIVLGIVTFNINYLNVLNYSIHTIVCLFLIIRFNPYREKITLHPIDSKIIFSTSIFLLLNMFIIEVIKHFFPDYEKDIEKIKHFI